jgi:hypothetical protein
LTTIEGWVRDWYGLTLHIDRSDFPLYVSTSALLAAAHAAGFVTALNHTDETLAAQLTSNSDLDEPVRLLAATRDLAWHAITAFAAHAHQVGFTSLPTGAHKRWKPVCVHGHDIGPKVYPALANTVHRDAPPRFTRTTAERISADLEKRRGQRLSVTFARDVLTVSHGDRAKTRRTRHEPDDDGLYAIGAGGCLTWKWVEKP